MKLQVSFLLYAAYLKVIPALDHQLPDESGEMSAVKLNQRQGLLMNQIAATYTLQASANQLCRNHSKELNMGLRALEPWALKMFDSSSKLQAGVLQGNLFDFGDFQQCLQVYKSSEAGVIRGRFCTLRVIPDVHLLGRILEFRNISHKRFAKVQQFVSNAALSWSVCVPDSCTAQDVSGHFSRIVYTLTEGLNVSLALVDKDCVSVAEEKPITRSEMLIMGFLAATIGLVVVVSMVDLVHFQGRPQSVSLKNNLVDIFSVYCSSRQIFAKKRGSDLDCVHGLRVLSTCYVVIGHRYLMLMFFPMVNSLRIIDWVLFYRSTAITGGTLCVDTFFMISGMLVSLGFFQEVDKSGKINWFLFYFYRYMRITPSLAIVVLCYATLVHHLGSGPLWNDMLDIVQTPCQEYWWATLLHIQNYVHPFPLVSLMALSGRILMAGWHIFNFELTAALIGYLCRSWGQNVEFMRVIKTKHWAKEGNKARER